MAHGILLDLSRVFNVSDYVKKSLVKSLVKSLQRKIQLEQARPAFSHGLPLFFIMEIIHRVMQVLPCA